MGHLQSPSKDIEGIEILPWPTRPTEMRVIRIDNVLVGVGKTGAVHSNVLNKKAFYSFSNWGGSENLLYALVELKRLPQEIVDNHVAKAKERSKQDNAMWQVESIIENCREQDIELEYWQIEHLLRRVRENRNPYQVNKVLKKLADLGVPKKLLRPVRIPKELRA